MEARILAWSIIGLILCFGLFLVWLRARPTSDPSAGPEPHPGMSTAGRQNPTFLTIGPTEPIVVGPGTFHPGDTRAIQENRCRGESTRRGPPLVIEPSRPLAIGPRPRDAWEEQGWTRRRKDGTWVYEGYYRVWDRYGRQRRFPGQIIMRSGEVCPYIADPPAELRTHPKGPCFMLTQAPWFRVHWHRPARNADEAILYIEQVLAEALNGRAI
ncbi:MAG: hypothetical protein ACP5OO_06180 [Chloroflexia bacterium]